MQKASIVITGNPLWRESVTVQLQDNFTVHHQATSGGYMNILIDSLPVLILVDSSDDNWATWTSSPKSSPATRRIPIILVSDDVTIRENASFQGADFAICSDELESNLLKIVNDYARLPDPEKMKQLDCECQEALPELAQEGIRKFNAGEYYKQHDLFEELWMATDSPVRDLYRAVLQVGIAYYQIERGNYRGAVKMLQRSVQWLVIMPDTCQGINVKKLREDSFRVRAELEYLGEVKFSELDQSLIQGVDYQA